MFNLPIIPHNLNPYLAYVFRWKHIRITQRPYCALRFLMLKISGKNCGRDFARELFSLFNNPPDKIKGMEMRATTHEGMLQQLKKLEKRGLIEILNVKEERQRLFLLEFLLIGNRKEAFRLTMGSSMYSITDGSGRLEGLVSSITSPSVLCTL